MHVKAGVDERAAAFEARLAGRARDEDLVAPMRKTERVLFSEDFEKRSPKQGFVQYSVTFTC